MRHFTYLIFTVALALGMSGCGSEKCPGIICSDCAASGDCNIQCSTGEVQFCGHFGYFDDPDLRCAYCGEP